MKIWEEGKTLEEEKECWIEYINFEISQKMSKRAKLLYERALISLDRDRHFWVSYILFLDKHLKDPALARAKFEHRLKHCDRLEVVGKSYFYNRFFLLNIQLIIKNYEFLISIES